MSLRSLTVLAAVFSAAFSNPVAFNKRATPQTPDPGPVQLVDFIGCSTDQTNIIKGAWDDGLAMASSVKVQGGGAVRLSSF